MNKSPEELLEAYLAALSEDPNAPIPTGLDIEVADFARQLTLSQRKDIQDRVWQKTLQLSSTMRSNQSKLRAEDARQLASVGRPANRRSYFSILLAAAALTILAWGLIQITRRSSGTIAAGQQTPTTQMSPTANATLPVPTMIVSVQNGHLNQIAWSPSRTLVAVASSSGVWLYQSDELDQSGQLLQGYQGSMTEVIFGPKGDMLASSSNTAVVVWDTKSASLKRLLPGAYALAFSADETTLATATQVGISLWDVVSGTNRLEWSENIVHSLAFSPRDNVLASGESDNTIRLWNTITGAKLGELVSPSTRSANITALAFSPDGNTLVSGASDNYVRVWDVSTRAQQASRADETQGVNSVSFSSDGNAVTYLGDTAWFWQFKSGKKPAFLDKDTTWWSLVFNLDNTPLALGIKDGIWRQWGTPPDSQKVLLGGYK